MIYNYSNIYSIYGLYLIWPVYTSCALRILQCEDFCDKLEFYKLQHIYKKKNNDELRTSSHVNIVYYKFREIMQIWAKLKT